MYIFFLWQPPSLIIEARVGINLLVAADGSSRVTDFAAQTHVLQSSLKKHKNKKNKCEGGDFIPPPLSLSL